jgi:hypothetical protein
LNIFETSPFPKKTMATIQPNREASVFYEPSTLHWHPADIIPPSPAYYHPQISRCSYISARTVGFPIAFGPPMSLLDFYSIKHLRCPHNAPRGCHKSFLSKKPSVEGRIRILEIAMRILHRHHFNTNYRNLMSTKRQRFPPILA